MTMNNYPAIDHRLCQVLAQTSLKKTKNKKEFCSLIVMPLLIILNTYIYIW